MYEPQHFKLEDQETLFAVIRANPLAILITNGPGGLMANPIPFLIAKNAAGEDVLRAHLARPNPQWRELADGEVLVVFQGGDHYVTPGWYATKRETGKVVPTWNYVHIQVRGRASVQDNAEFVRAQIEALTDQQEMSRAEAWAVSDGPEAFITAQMRGIVGIEIAIDSISGKFKLSQNRNEADRQGVVSGLALEANAAGPAMANTMQRFSKPIS
ncbi:MAG: transcriptional regulator [Rhizobiales bacterium PAR1]|nr:MAG: transcriptional regulator [Rhizobiales bacterium PAR1]